MPQDTATIQARLADLNLEPEVERLATHLLNRVAAGETLEAVVGFAVHHVRTKEAAAKLEKILEGLLEAPPVLYKLEELSYAADGSPRVTVRVRSQLRELLVHPAVEPAQLAEVGPLDYVCVNKEMIVTGRRIMRDNPAAVVRQQGSVAEFKSYHDRENGSAVVMQSGQGSEVVQLAPWLRGDTLLAGAQVVLSRDEPSWAIDSIPTECVESKYEISIDDLDASLSALAGLDDLSEELVQQILLRVAFPDLRREFNLAPLGGILLTSRKPGMGKTALVRALVHDLRDFGREHDFSVALYLIPPTALKSVWHGQDGANVRELFASIRARCASAGSERLLCFVVFDEIDSLGARGDGSRLVSSAQNDVVQAMLEQMDGVVNSAPENADVVYIGMTTREELVDPQLRRPERFGGMVREIPDYTADGAEHIMLTYARAPSIPWRVNGKIAADLDAETIRQCFIRPAVARVFDTAVMHYSAERQRDVPVAAGRILSAVNFKNAMTKAKEAAATRTLHRDGVPALCGEDLIGALFDEAYDVARQLVSDHAMLCRVVNIKPPLTGAELIPADEVRADRYLRNDG